MENLKLQRIAKKYSTLNYNSDNYNVGGGLSSSGKKESNRHEDALSDKGKLTFGKASQMFKRATGLSLNEVKEIIKYAVPNMEWHHAGFMPKRYGGGMKKTYFLNSDEIVEIATNWQNLVEKLEISKTEKRIAAENKRNSEKIKQKFLKKYAIKVERVEEIPKFFYETNREMNGKYGWFSSYGKSYNMTEYYSGWKFKSIKKLNEFYNL